MDISEVVMDFLELINDSNFLLSLYNLIVYHILM